MLLEKEKGLIEGGADFCGVGGAAQGFAIEAGVFALADFEFVVDVLFFGQVIGKDKK